MQRHKRHLQAEAREDEDRPCLHGAPRAVRLQDPGHVRHVQRSRCEVQEAHPKQVERPADGAEHQVAESGHHAGPSAHEHQRVSSERRNLQEHEQVEQVAGDDHPRQTGQEEHHQAVERSEPVAGLAVRPPPRPHDDEHRHTRYHQSHERGHAVDDVLDAHGRGPAAEVVRQRTAVEHGGERQGRSSGRERDARERQGEREVVTNVSDDRHDDRQNDQGERDQNGELAGIYCRTCSSRDSSSSVPNSR